jgi:hypothetical protein
VTSAADGIRDLLAGGSGRVVLIAATEADCDRTLRIDDQELL